MFSEPCRLESPTGARLAYRHLPAHPPSRAILLISHGLGEHAGRYERFATAMAQHGMQVYVHDHRGHGQTTAGDAPAGRFARRSGDTAVVGDVMAMRGHAAARHPGLPIVIFGHSMGGLIALNTAIAAPGAFNAVAIWNTSFRPRLIGRVAQGLLSAERMLKGSDVPSAFMPRMTLEAWADAIPGRRTPFDWLSSDETEVDRFIADPLCGSDVSVSLWSDLLRLAYRGSDARSLSRLPRALPILCVGGGRDPATRNGRDVLWHAARLRRQGFTGVTVTIYETARHETLNDHTRDEATADFAGWCRSVLREPTETE